MLQSVLRSVFRKGAFECRFPSSGRPKPTGFLRITACDDFAALAPGSDSLTRIEKQIPFEFLRLARVAAIALGHQNWPRAFLEKLEVRRGDFRRLRFWFRSYGGSADNGKCQRADDKEMLQFVDYTL